MAKGHILIVDSSKEVVDALGDFLTNEGFSVSTATEGSQAISQAVRTLPDVILMDIWLPGMDGIETLQRLQKLSLDLNVVIMSNHDNIETAVATFQYGAFDYIKKPTSPSDIVAPITRALHYRHTGQFTCSPPVPQTELLELIGPISPIEHLLQQVSLLQMDDSPVFIQGGAGCGQALIARLIHQRSQRCRESFIAYPCLHKDQHILNRQLFGAIHCDHNNLLPPIKGAFELANGGTLYLDTINNLPHQVQQKLAQVLTSGQIRRQAGSVSIPLNVRLIVSSTIPLEQLVAERILVPDFTSLFRSEPLVIPSLHARKADIPNLVNRFLKFLANQHDMPPKQIDDDAMDILLRHDWLENYEELKQTVENAYRAASNGRITPHHLNVPAQGNANASPYRPRSTKPISSELQQRTLRHSMTLHGRGLQSGLKTGVILSPLPPNSGIIFSSITTGERIPALVKYVASTDYSTSLHKGNFTARTIEHLLSALHAYRISNLLIKMTDEVPIMDGSALAFCQLIEQAGVREQHEGVEEFVIKDCFHIGTVQPDTKHLLVEPYNGLRITYRLHYPRPLGIQEFSYEHINASSYQRDIAPARTFSFVSDIEKMHELDLLAGGRLNNAILLDGEKIVNNTELRFPEECARHKVLDLMGDLYLLGKPLRGHIRANLTGHTENIVLVQKLYDILHNGH